MAINKKIITKSKTPATYSRIGYIELMDGAVRGEAIVRGRVDVYYNEEAYLNGALKVDKIPFSLVAPKSDALTLTAVYQHLMANVEQFKDSEAILEEPVVEEEVIVE